MPLDTISETPPCPFYPVSHAVMGKGQEEDSTGGTSQRPGFNALEDFCL